VGGGWWVVDCAYRRVDKIPDSKFMIEHTLQPCRGEISASLRQAAGNALANAVQKAMRLVSG